jgi:hypothetical protein
MPDTPNDRNPRFPLLKRRRPGEPWSQGKEATVEDLDAPPEKPLEWYDQFREAFGAMFGGKDPNQAAKEMADAICKKHNITAKPKEPT